MVLTASIIFVGATIGIILWVVRIMIFFSDSKTKIEIMMGATFNIGIAIPLILFIIIAMCWYNLGIILIKKFGRISIAKK